MQGSCNLTLKMIFETLAAQQTFRLEKPNDWEDQEWLEGADLTDIQKYPIGQRAGYLRPVTIWMRNAWHYIKAARADFPGDDDSEGAFPGAAPGVPGREYFGVNTEDISRFFFLINHIRSKERADRSKKVPMNYLDKLETDQDYTAKGKTHKGDAVKPLFKTSSGARAPTKQEVAQQNASLRQIVMRTNMENDPTALLQKRNKIDADPAAADENMEIIQKLLTENQAKRGKKKSRYGASVSRESPAIQDDMREAVIEALTSGLVIIFDRSEDEARSAAVGFVKDSTARHLAAFAQAMLDNQGTFLGDQNSRRKFIDDVQIMMDADKEFRERLLKDAYETRRAEDLDISDEEITKTAVDLAVARSFKKFQGGVNALSAVPPSYEEALEWTGFTEMTDPDVEGAPRAHGNGTVPLHPYQVQGVAFCGKMMVGELHCAMESDETGLGKTIQAIEADQAVSRQIGLAMEREGGKSNHKLPLRNRANLSGVKLAPFRSDFTPEKLAVVFTPDKSD